MIHLTILSLLTVGGLIRPGLCLPNQIRVGILLHQEEAEHEMVFRSAIDQINMSNVLNRTKLSGIVKHVKAGNSWDAQLKTCQLIESGSVFIVGPPDSVVSQHVGSMCDSLETPHINIVSKGITFNSLESLTVNIIVNATFPQIDEGPSSSSSIDLSIDNNVYIGAYVEVLRALEWKNFVYLYEGDESLYYLQQQFNGASLKTNSMNLKIISFEPTKPYRDIFWSLKSTGIKQIMLDVSCKNLHAILKQAQQVSMMTEAHSYLIACFDTHTIDMEDFKYSRARIMWLSPLNSVGDAMDTLRSRAASINTKYANFRHSLHPEQLRVNSALIQDSIVLIAKTLQNIDSSIHLDGKKFTRSCEQQFQYGSSLVNYMRTTELQDELTGPISFDSTSKRINHRFNILRLTETKPKLIGNWTSHSNGPSQLVMDKTELQYARHGDPTLYEGEQRDLLIVTSIKSEPYFMNKQTTKIEKGNARYEGYAIDLIDELSRIVGFDYEFKEVDDNKYGKPDEVTGQWNGMILEVMIGKADLAIADLSITSSREDAVDFTLPFMNTGISILFKKPTTKELELFSFLSPFENHVWFYVGGAYVGVSTILFIVGRISPYEWADPHPCRREDKILRNQFSVSNSFWFTIAAVMQQGSDLAPRSLSTRLVAAIWYFFTLIMISSYTANLAAFLTVEKVVYPIERAEDLYNNPHGIKYGCVESGSTMTYFQQARPHSTFAKMSKEMQKISGNDDGKAITEAGNFAFFMESTSIEYTIERKCNLTQIGGLLDSKGYGIALAKNSTRKRDYRTKLSEAILSLQESGMLEVLKNRWWKEKRGGGACDIDDSQGGESVKELTLANVGGVFVVLGLGITTSLFMCGLELYFKSCRLASAQGSSRSEQLKRRVKFALSLSENY